RAPPVLQVCADCGAVQYPPRAACRQCLSERLEWRAASGGGVVLAEVGLHASLDQYFAARTPWPVVSVRLDEGVTVLAHAAGAVSGGDNVRVVAEKDPSDRWVLVAQVEGGASASPFADASKEDG
ncbi:MAG: zinc ribbon domain-containing protein, partial [Pseudomonadota bacterium]